MIGCHYFLPCLRLPSQPHSITAPCPIPSYTAWWQRHIDVNYLPKIVTQLCQEQDLNPRPVDRKSNALSVVPPYHWNSSVIITIVQSKLATSCIVMARQAHQPCIGRLPWVSLPSSAHSHRRYGPPSNTRFLGPTRVSPSNDIWAGWAIFAQHAAVYVLGKNGWTNSYAIRGADSCGSKESRIRWGPISSI